MIYDEKTGEFFKPIDENHLHIYLRIKDGIEDFDDLYEVPDPQTIISKHPDGCNLIRNTKDDVVMKKYKFTKIFGPETKQIEIFRELVRPKLLKFLRTSHNSTLMTYGVSSSGKTYTVVGTAEEPGVVPRSLEFFFRNLPIMKEMPPYKPLPYGKIVGLTEDEMSKESQLKDEILHYNWTKSVKCEHINTYSAMQSCIMEPRQLPIFQNDFASTVVGMWVSFAEIYNEHIYDLLRTGESKKKEKLKICSANGETYVKDLTLLHVSSGLEAYQVLQYGLRHLNYAKTNINDHSSRSHSVFTIWLTEAAVGGGGSIVHFNFCDLAGAERSKKTLNVGDRLKESNNINTSLLVLGRCIAAVRKAQYIPNNNIIPFRESKLTQLFQKALSGQEPISMIVNMNPCKELLEETQHVLNFSAIAKDIVVNESPLMLPRRSERITQLLRQRLDDAIGIERVNGIEELKNELAEIVDKMEMEDMDRMKEIEMMRNHIISEYNKKQEEQNEEMEYEILALKKRLIGEHKKQLQEVKLEIMQKYGISDDGSVLSSNSSAEVIYGSDEELDSAPDTVGAINLVSSDDEEEEEVEKWRRQVDLQEDLIAEHHKTISCLRKQIDELKLRIDGLESGRAVGALQELERGTKEKR